MSGISAYHENAIATQSRGRLIVLLYDGAVKFLKQAIAEIEKGDWVRQGPAHQQGTRRHRRTGCLP